MALHGFPEHQRIEPKMSDLGEIEKEPPVAAECSERDRFPLGQPAYALRGYIAGKDDGDIFPEHYGSHGYRFHGCSPLLMNLA